MSNATFELRYADGQVFTVTPDQLWGMLLSVGQINEVTVSTKEQRQRLKFEGVEKFVSGRRNYERAWAIVNSVTDPVLQKEARRLANLAIQKDIMETEAWFTQMIQMMFAKDNLQPYWRSPENPFVKAGWDIQAAFTNGGTITEGTQSA